MVLHEFKTKYNDVEYLIKYYFHKGCDGTYGRYGEPLDPPDEDEVQLVSITNLITGIVTPWDKVDENPALNEDTIYNSIWEEVDRILDFPSQKREEKANQNNKQNT